MNDHTPINPVTLLDSLDIEAIRTRLDELDREARALRVLLRSACVRQRGQPTPGAAIREEATHATS